MLKQLWLLGLAAGLLATGCEENSEVIPVDVDGDGVLDGALLIEPNRVTLYQGEDGVILEATGGEAPYTWRTDDPDLGTITSPPTRIVTYSREGAANGTNIVRVQDNRGYRATARIVQNDEPAPDAEDEMEPDALSVAPANTTLADVPDNVELTATGGVPPYSWSVTNGSLGRVTAFGNQNANMGLYEANGVAGTQRVIARDSEGNNAAAVVVQEIAEPAVP